MKTAEEWKEKALKETGDLLCNADYYKTWAEQIQLDAMKEGMKRAALKAVTRKHIVGNSCDEDITQAILTASERLTEKDI